MGKDRKIGMDNIENSKPGKDTDLCEDIRYFEWDSDNDAERKIFTFLASSNPVEWMSKGEDDLWL